MAAAEAIHQRLLPPPEMAAEEEGEVPQIRAAPAVAVVTVGEALLTRVPQAVPTTHPPTP